MTRPLRFPEPRNLLNANWLRARMHPLRAAHPETYAALNRIRRRLLGAGEGLDGYQANALRGFAGAARIEGARILEIGSDARMDLLRCLKRRGARDAVGVNISPALWAACPDGRIERHGATLLRGDASAMPFEDATFDHVFSVAVFEHLADLDAALAEMHRVVRPGGVVYAAFGPIWSGAKGHHVRAEVDGVLVHHGLPASNPLPDFSHLLLDEDEMRRALTPRVSPAMADAIVAWVFHADDISRRFHHEYVDAFHRSPLVLRAMRPELDPVPPALDRILRFRWPREARFDVTNSEVVLEKR